MKAQWIDWLIDYCLTYIEEDISYIQDENETFSLQ